MMLLFGAIASGSTPASADGEFGSISGTVTFADTGEPAVDYTVCAIWPFRCTQTSASGEYSITGLELEVDYRVYVGIPDPEDPGSLEPWWYSGTWSYDDASTVSVGDVADVSGIDFQLPGDEPPAALGSISGTVTDAVTGEPVSGYQVCAGMGAPSNCDYTSATGTYTLADLVPQTGYRVAVLIPGDDGTVVWFHPGTTVWEDGSNIDVGAGEAVSGIDFQLPGDEPPVALGSISGTVTDAVTGEPLDGIEVCADQSGELTCVTSEADGSYTLDELAGGCHFISFARGIFLYASYDHGYVCDWSDESFSIDGIDAALQRAGAISGTVTDEATGEPLAGVDVCPTLGDLSEGLKRQYGACTTTDLDGDYVISGLAPGQYFVEFLPLGTLNGAYPDEDDDLLYTIYANEVYDGAPWFETASVVDVTGWEATSGIDASLNAGGSISGRVTAASSGEPLAGVVVCGYLDNDLLAGNRFVCTRTGADGEYLLRLLPAHDHTVRFNPPNASYLGAQYDGYRWWPGLGGEGSTPVSVTLGETTTGIDAALEDAPVTGSISGTVTMDGTPADGAIVCALPITEEYGYCATTDSSGEYTIAGLPPGDDYVVRVPLPWGGARYFGGADSIEDAATLTVVSGETVTGIDIEVPGLPTQTGSISGTVTDEATGLPIADRLVCAYSTGTMCTFTDADGNYTVPLAAGSYIIGFTGPDGESIVEYYDDVLNRDDATPVEVIAGEHVTGIDAALGSSAPSVRLEGLPSVIRVGDEVEVTAVGMEPGELVTFTMHSDPVVLGTATAGEAGSAVLRFIVPAVDAGDHEVRAVGATSERVATAQTRVIAASNPSGPGGTRPETGNPGSDGSDGGTDPGSEGGEVDTGQPGGEGTDPGDGTGTEEGPAEGGVPGQGTEPGQQGGDGNGSTDQTGSLARTGSSPMVPAALGLIMLLIGASMLRSARNLAPLRG